jgi:hypothetical protein
MALTEDEVVEGGFVRDRDTLALVVTSDTTGAAMESGFLRDPDRRLIVVEDV